jgi:O-antigen ligase
MNIKKFIPIAFFVLAISIVPYLYKVDTIRNALTIKYVGWVFLLGATSLIFFKNYKQEKISVSSIGAIFLFFLLSCVPSFSNTLNISESLFEFSKLILFGITVWFSYKLLDKDFLTRQLPLIATVASGILIFTILKQVDLALKTSAPWTSNTYLITGQHAHRNLVAFWAFLLIPIVSLGFSNQQKNYKLLYKFTVGALVIIVLLLTTRSALLALTVSTLLFFALQKIAKASNAIKIFNYGLVSISIIVVSCLLITLFTNIPQNALASLNLPASSIQERVVLWQKTILMIKDNSFWGVGGGNWRILFPNYGMDGLYRAELNDIVFNRPHNDLLWIWSEFGLIALLAFLAFLFYTIHLALKASASDSTNRTALHAAIAGIVGFMIISLFDFPKERVEHMIALAILVAVILSLSKPSELYSLKVSPISVPLFVLVIVSSLGFIGLKRYNAEQSIRNILAAKQQGNNQLILQEVSKVDTSFIQLDDNALPVIWYEGIAYFNLGDMKTATSKFKRAYELNPYNFNVVNNAGTSYLTEQDYATAEQLFKEAIRINPRSIDPKLNLTLLNINQQKWEEANYWIQQVDVQNDRIQNLRTVIGNNLNQ